jgi:hypothetical protein
MRHKLLDMRDGRIGQDAVAKIEDMGPLRQSVNDVVDRRNKLCPPGNQRKWVEIALHR